MARRRREMRKAAARRGTVSIEMLMALLPLLFSFLGILQLCLFMMGKLVVQHAAGRAVRSAIVILDDDPQYYDGAPRYDLEAGAAREEEGLIGFGASISDAYSALLGGGEVQGGARLQAIRKAAYHPLAVLAPNFSAVYGAPHLKGELADSPWLRIGLYALAYNRGAASVQVELQAGGPVTKNHPRAPIVVRVNYLLSCGVPLVNRIMCLGGHDLLQASLGVFPEEEAVNVIEKMQHTASPLVRDAIFAGGGRFALISAEAVLPNQGAPYH